MKSRNFLHSDPIENKGSTAKGFLLMRSPQADVAASAAVRRFELQHNASPRFARRRQERRKGQALLLAVLIMLLAALLSAGFLGVVSGNLNQTARIADKTRAIEASRAGIAFANAQLSGSSQGDLWRPIDVSPAPVPGSTNPDYDYYYSQLDKVQGWANSLTPPTNTADPNYQRDLSRYRNVTYGKFPDPNQTLGDAPKFLVRVEELPVDPADPYYNATYNPGHAYDAEHAGQLKITSIGLSDDDPNVFHRSVAYKSGRRASPWASALRSVSNWRFGNDEKNTGVPYARVANTIPINTPTRDVAVQVNTTDTPAFLETEVPFNVVVINKDTATPANSTVRGAVVTKVDVTAGVTTLTLARMDSTITDKEVIQKAAAIGTASTVDLLNISMQSTSVPLGYFALPPQEQPKGILANGSLWLQGQIELTSLQKSGSKIQSSGALSLSGNQAVLPSSDVTGVGLLAPSSSNTFPGNFTPATGIKKTDLVNDAWDRLNVAEPLGLNYSGNRERVVEPFTPVKIDSTQNLARYRALTRNAPTNSAGEKEGIYIDNRDDVEKVGSTPMTQKQLIEMLVSTPSATPTNYTRSGTAEPLIAANKSLEEQHLRGWVGPDEFLPRGALIEVVPTTGTTVPYLRVTLDARSDNTTADTTRAQNPNPDKSWRKPDGSPDTGVYTKLISWPDNGTIFAEGNVRIRGDLTGVTTPVPRSLTVVSMGNIYVEGSLSVDSKTLSDGITPDPNRKKLMLLAKKNVIVNPTRAVLARTDVLTRTINATTPITANGSPTAPQTITVPVADGLGFNVGDYADVLGQVNANDLTPKKIRGLVKTVVAKQITLETTDSGYVRESSNSLVRSPLEARERTVTANPTAPAVFSVVDTENALNRRIVAPIFVPGSIPGSSLRNRLVFDHVGELKQNGTNDVGLKVVPKALPGFTLPSDFKLTNKQVIDASDNPVTGVAGGSVTNADKLLRIYQTSLTPNKDSFPNPLADKLLSDLNTEINGFAGNSDTVSGVGYQYEASLLEPPTVIPALSSIGTLRYYALAGVGLRYDAGTPYTPADKGRKPFSAPAGYTIPLATSVEFDLNSTLRDLIGPLGATAHYFGFNPSFANPVPLPIEDALTVDKSFYRKDAESDKSTLDSRELPAVTALPVNSVVLKRTNAMTDPAKSDLLPDYRVRSLKLETFDLVPGAISPVASTMKINAFVYAQEGSWFIIPGEYFRADAPVRATVYTSGPNTGNFKGSYIDYNRNNAPDCGAGECLLDSSSPQREIADLNRNGTNDYGERQAALRMTRYNYFQIQFLGAIVENQTAVVADVTMPSAGIGVPPVVVQQGAVQDWMDKWITYNDGPNGPAPGVTGSKNNFKFMTYTYDSSLADGGIGANQLRVPVTDDLLYQQ